MKIPFTLADLLKAEMLPCKDGKLTALINLHLCSCLELTQVKEATLVHVPVPIPPPSVSSSVADFTLSVHRVTKDLNYTVC